MTDQTDSTLAAGSKRERSAEEVAADSQGAPADKRIKLDLSTPSSLPATAGEGVGVSAPTAPLTTENTGSIGLDTPDGDDSPDVSVIATSNDKKSGRSKNKRRTAPSGKAQSAKRGRAWGPRETKEGAEGEGGGEGGDAEDSGPRLPKKKVALLMGYCGTGYNGMQINPGVATIEAELHKALAESGAVSKDNANDPAKIQFMRAARTDKGVHAAGQVCSLKMIIEDPTIISKINQHLPEQIRVWGYVRTTNAFHAKNACDSRIYEYFLPTFVLAPAAPYLYPFSALAKSHGISTTELPTHANESFDDLTAKPTADQLAARRAFRIGEERLGKLREALKGYEGTHNFHNFTVGKGFGDSSAMRFMIDLTVSDPIIRGDLEWVKCKIFGQSFMLHQIRKMIGLAILMIRTSTPATLINEAFLKEKLNIPKAPALGLLLERTVYRMYNEKWASEANDRAGVSFDAYEGEIDAFKEKWIYSRLVEEEVETNA
ncbi:tRNA pseudouridine synthase A [Fimicolochytrium jonesii]|uniref:tRNA pseudouridine synthase A n=1 Tax=Fimicolochytrium jonesii TaxID=1396493 RepID=UPI0022FDD74F|nr:tRNA pseudouridine synthase A [Fimicolochytrium jonesii]KAI8827168.1 tRNA pseudouridine synthase A [Fimicolochytrium jonesii]